MDPEDSKQKEDLTLNQKQAVLFPRVGGDLLQSRVF